MVLREFVLDKVHFKRKIPSSKCHPLNLGALIHKKMNWMKMGSEHLDPECNFLDSTNKQFLEFLIERLDNGEEIVQRLKFVDIKKN